MSETPHRNSQTWGWKWKKRKQTKKRHCHSNGQPVDSHHGGSHHVNAEDAQSNCRDRDNGGVHRLSNRPYQQQSYPRNQRSFPASRSTTSAKTSLVSSSPSAHVSSKRTDSLSSSESFNERKSATSSSTCTCTSHQGASTSRTQSDSNGASTETATASASKPQIPGFYYDADKKRYFRLVAGHNNFNPLTRESLLKKDAETKRKQMLEDNLPSCRNHYTPIRKLSLGSLQSHLQTGQLTSRQFTRYCHEQAIGHLDLRPTKLDSFPDQYFDGESGDISFLQVDESQQKVLMVLSHDYLSRMWQGTITCDPTRQKALTVSNWKVINIIGTRNTKVTSAAWISWENNLYVIYSLCGGPMNSVQLLKCSSEEDGHNHITYSYESNHESAWTCAWSVNPLTPEYLSIGSNNKAIVVDTRSAGKWKIFTNHSDVLAQVFATRSPVLYNGTRRGEILGCDLRTLSETRSDFNLRLRQKVAVCSVRLLRDENYLLASDLSGQIRLWDIRQCLCVQEFKGHHNRHSILPICVDSTESVLYGVGQDDYTRFWSLHDGHLLRTVPCPQPSSALHPRVTYSREWHNGAPPGLLLGVQRDLYWYPLG